MILDGYANYADVVTDDFVRGIVGDKYTQLFSMLSEMGVELDNLVGWVFCEEEVEADEAKLRQASQLLEEIKEDFEKNTGLVLSVGFHDSAENGSVHDEVDGWFWQVGNVYTLTEAGKKFADQIQRCFYIKMG